MFTKFLGAWLLLCSVALGQIDVKSATYYQISGLGKVVTVGDLTLVPSIPKIDAKPVGVVSVETQSADPQVSFTDHQRSVYPAKKVTDKNWLIEKPGKYWVEVREYGDIKLADGTTRRLMLDSKTVVVEFKFEPGPGPDPGPGPTPPPPNPSGPFDGLAAKVRVEATQVSDAQRQKIAAVLNASADKMQSFEFKQVAQARDYIARNWPPCDSPHCGAIFKLVYDDAVSRNLSWQETQQYYREVAKGVAK